jgi:hypothetical protein
MKKECHTGFDMKIEVTRLDIDVTKTLIRGHTEGIRNMPGRGQGLSEMWRLREHSNWHR